MDTEKQIAKTHRTIFHKEDFTVHKFFKKSSRMGGGLQNRIQNGIQTVTIEPN